MEASRPDDRALQEAWRGYRNRVTAVEPYEDQLLDSRELLLVPRFVPDDETLEELAAASEQVENRLLIAQWHVGRPSDTAERLEDTAVAVAALDLQLAADIYRLTVSPEEWDQLVGASGVDPVAVSSLIAQTAEADMARLAELVRDIDATLGTNELVGAQDTVLPLRTLTDDTVADLVGKAREPILAFVRLVPTLILPEAVRTVLSVGSADPFQLLSPVQSALRRPFAAAARLVISGFHKLASAMGLGPDTILGAVTALLGDQIAQRLDELRGQNVDRAIGTIVRQVRCEDQVREILQKARPECLKDPPGELQAAYIALQTGFGEKQGRARKIAGIMRWLAPFIVVVHPPVGPAALLAIILVGAGYPLLGLADRLDTSSFLLIDRVNGVPKLLKAHVT